MGALKNSHDEARSVELLQLLRQHNADFNCRDDYGYTLLLTAAFSANSMAIGYLLSKKLANISEINNRGETALMILMYSHGWNHLVEFTKVKKTLDILLNQFNCDPNITNNSGETALIVGVIHGV